MLRWSGRLLVSVRSFGALARCAILVLGVSGIGYAAAARETDSLVLIFEGNRLSVKESAPVLYSNLSAMLVALGRGSLRGQYAIVLFRNSPRAIVGYILAVEREGTLSLGRQLHDWDAGDRRYRLLRGELFRSYQPLEGNLPWTWLVTIPISRELQASLMIHAVEVLWPVESVLISVTVQPRH